MSLLDGNVTVDRHRFGNAIIAFSLGLALFMTVALQPAKDWSHDRLMLSTIVNLERLNTR
ncbi:hypothetical protein QTO30_08700 [Yoonia sp. GPGPB17]|uniref:hypothetical protein n=1 Tax=Yoonia sp. GPGPB17 TaxID=3026147 RepID=UPI0030C5FBC9